MICPNVHPIIPPTSTRLAVVGEAPGRDEMLACDAQGNIKPEPFVGASGKFLRAIISQCGGSTNQTFFGNICQYNPPDNDIEIFPFEGPEIQKGIQQLTRDLSEFRPNCILLLGRTAFRAFRPGLCYPTKGGFHVPLADWRGSVFTIPELGGVKAVGTYHPAYILRSWNDFPFFKFDVARAVRQAQDPEYKITTRKGNLRPTLADLRAWVERVRSIRACQTIDIEGYADVTGITMLGLCDTANPSTGIVIPFRIDGGDYWSLEEEVEVWRLVSELLADPTVPKVVHNGFYELFVSAWRHRMVINNIVDDTMMAHWELYPDFAKGDKDEKHKASSTQRKRSLGVCCSLYTDQPYYKDDRLSNDTDTKLNYNFLDVSVTSSVRNSIIPSLQRTPASYAHYRFNINIIPAFNYIMLRGCKLDLERVKEHEQTTVKEIADLSTKINGELEQRGAFGAFPCRSEEVRALQGFNVKSPKQKAWLLYDHLGNKPLKKFLSKKSGKPGADENALLHYWSKSQDSLLRLIIRCVRKRTRLSDIHKLVPDADGRIRTSYDIVGTNTGRLSSRASMSLRFDGDDWESTGTNLQNVTKELRDCFIPDSPDFDFWQFDLSGADGWTVGAELAHLGHSAMLDDYLAGIKPALVLDLMLRERAAGRNPAAVNLLPRSEIKRLTREIKRDYDAHAGEKLPDGRDYDWQYFCCKKVAHGSNYGGEENKIAELIFNDSDGSIVITPKDAGLYQSYYKLRYKTDARNDWIRTVLSKTSCVTASCGIRRQFFGIRGGRDVDDEIVRQASSFNPQANTTYTTNKALEAMWYDPENRRGNGSLFVEPLIQVHDAFCGQYPVKIRDWARGKFKPWFKHTIRVSGIEVTIPVEGNYGTSWKGCTTPINT